MQMQYNIEVTILMNTTTVEYTQLLTFSNCQRYHVQHNSIPTKKNLTIGTWQCIHNIHKINPNTKHGILTTQYRAFYKAYTIPVVIWYSLDKRRVLSCWF